MNKSRSPRARDSGRYRFRECVLAILLDPVALIVLLVLVLYSAPGDAMCAVLFSVLILCGVEGLLVDLLGVLGQVVLHVVRKLCDLLVGHRVLLGSGAISLSGGTPLTEELLVAVAKLRTHVF